MTPKEIDDLRSTHNEKVMFVLRNKEGIIKCSVAQIEDNTDSGYLLNVTFDENKTNEAEVLSTFRQILEEFNVPCWLMMEPGLESDNTIIFMFIYMDEYNKTFSRGTPPLGGG